MRARMLRILSVGLVALGLLAPGSAAAESADGKTPESALPFQSEQSFALQGGLNGHFAYFAFAYPGGWPVDIELRPQTDDKLLLKYVGYKVYGPETGREYVDGKLDENQVWQGGRQLFSGDRGVYVIQVYNYYPDPNATIGFSLVGNNIPPQPAEGEEQPTPEAGSAGHTAIPVKEAAPTDQAQDVKRGTLEAAAGGTFRYYQFTQPSNTTVRIEMQVTPGSQGILDRAGFKVYGPERGKEYLQSESSPGKAPNAAGSLYVTQGGVYVVQVYNYNPQTPVDYSLVIKQG
jgi:hypothetical protein